MRGAWLFAPLLVVTAASVAWAQETAGSGTPAYSGKDLFRMYCAACHGPAARGDGPLADKLKKRPPDLTQLAKQNGGKFAPDIVHRIVDGR